MRAFRTTLLLLLLALRVPLIAGPFSIQVSAPDYAGKAALLYRYDDLFTMRTIRIASGIIDEAGRSMLQGEVEGTQKVQLRVGDAVADLYLRPGMALSLHFPEPDARTPKSLSGTTRVSPLFTDIDALDINALISDLNERIDAFILEDLATDQASGMNVLEQVRTQRELQPGDSVAAKNAPRVMPLIDPVRIDTFEAKLARFYRGVDDAWFTDYRTYALGGLRQGPGANDRALHDRYLNGRTVHYGDPEYVRFVRGAFAGHLVKHTFMHHEKALQRAMALGDADSLKALFARHDFLKDDDRLCELVMLDQVYLHFNTPYVQKAGALRMIGHIAETSAYTEHRRIATNMRWDLTAMRAGHPLPPLHLENLRGKDVAIDSLLAGPVCLAITASWCTYCELELSGLEQLQKEYGQFVRILTISLDPELNDLRTYLRQYPQRNWTWLHATAEQQLREDLRLRNLPAFFLLEDGVLVRSPAALPSEGLGAWFHRAKVEAQQEGRIKVWDD